MSQEFAEQRTPQSGNHPNSQVPIYDELDLVYQSQTEITTNNKLQSERIISPISKKLYGLARNISEARAYRLDTQFFIHEENKNHFMKAISKKLFNKDMPLRRYEPLTEDRLIKEESEIGATIFGTTRPNEHVEFFNHDHQNWFFYQGINDSRGNIKSVTLHYEVHPTSVLRISSNPDIKNEFIEGQELDNFLSATEIYHERVMNQIYTDHSNSGKKAA